MQKKEINRQTETHISAPCTLEAMPLPCELKWRSSFSIFLAYNFVMAEGCSMSGLVTTEKIGAAPPRRMFLKFLFSKECYRLCVSGDGPSYALSKWLFPRNNHVTESGSFNVALCIIIFADLMVALSIIEFVLRVILNDLFLCTTELGLTRFYLK